MLSSTSVVLTMLAAATAVSASTGCASSAAATPGPAHESPGPVVKSTMNRVTTPVVSAADAKALEAGNDAFAGALYQNLAASPAFAGQNLFFSPYSISTALAMTYAGAAGETARQMAAALRYTLPQERLHPAFNAVELSLAPTGGAADAGTPAFELRAANALWASPDVAFEPTFLGTLSANYGAGVRLADFREIPDESRVRINDWVKDETNGKIADLLSKGSITKDTRLVLANAVYFKAAWQVPFEKAATIQAQFHAPAGDVPVSMMRQTQELGYAAGSGWQAVAMPYSDGRTALVAVVPDDLAKFESTLTGPELDAIAGATAQTYKNVAVSLPRFTIKGSSFSLAKSLEAMGMVDAFQQDLADFSGMSKPSLVLSDVFHQAFVSVDESGTEAAAATAVIGEVASIPPEPKVVTFDKPFVFFVQDRTSGAVLFLGRVVNP